MPDNETAWSRRSSRLRKLILAGGALLVLLVAAYFVLTSGAFFKGVILPRVAAGMNSEITVADASISPFSQVILRDLKVTPKGKETLLTAAEIRLRYSLLSIIGGKLVVDELTLESPSVTLVQDADGTSNLDPVLKSSPSAVAKAPAAPAAAAKPLQLDLKRVSLKNASVKQTVKFKAGGQQIIELASGNLTLADFKNGQAGKMDFDADLKLTTTAPTNASLAAKLTSHFTVGLGPDAQPTTVNGALQCVVQQATGALADLNAFSAVFECDMTPTEAKLVAFKFRSGTTDLGQARLSGPLDLAKQEGKLKLEVYGIDRRVLNLAAHGQGLDFGTTAFSSTNQIELSAGGKIIALSGQFVGTSISVARQGLVTPALDAVAAYDVSVDQTQQTAWLRAFQVDVSRDRKPLLKGALSKPMKFEWRPGASAVEESELTLALTGLDLRDYRAFVGSNVLDGVINAALGIQAKAAGRQTFVTLTADGAGLAAAAGSNAVSGMGFALRSSATVYDFQRLQIDKTDFKVLRGGTEVAHAQVSGNVELKKQSAALAINANASLPALAALAPTPGLALTAGKLAFDATFKQDNLTLPGQTTSFARSLEGNLSLADLTGTSGATRFENFDTALAFEVALKNTLTTLRKLTGTVHQGERLAGSYDAQAEFDSTTQGVSVSGKLVNLNENALRPFLGSALGDKSLASVTINASLSGSYKPATESAIKGELSVTNLVVKDPSGKLPATPLEAKLKLDVGLRKQVADVRDCTLTLTPTARAKNSAQLTGTVDFTQTNAITGSLKFLADALDATSYYDRFTGGAPAATGPATVSAPATPAADPNQEPAPVLLPFRNFTAEARVGHFYLREVDIANFQSTLKLDGGRVILKPFQLMLNGAPVKADADLNLGVKGYTYDVSFDAQALPLPPLVDSFQPDRKGQFGGTAIASAQIKGAGVTGASLQKNLSGQFQLATTNLNFSLGNARSAALKSIINLVVSIPDLIRNPTAGIGNLLGKLTSTPAAGAAGGWGDQLMQSPVNAIVLRGGMGNGQVKLEEASIQSPAFLGQASGSIALNPVLTNSSLQIPLQISLARGLAEKVKLVPDGTPTNAVFVKLPDFVTMKGTVGAPKPDINYVALTALALKGSGGMLGGTGNANVDKASGILGAVGGLLGGGTAAPTGTTTATNPATKPATAAGTTSVGNLLGGLLGGAAAPATSNSPAVSGTNPPAAPAPNLFDLFKKPKQ